MKNKTEDTPVTQTLTDRAKGILAASVSSVTPDSLAAKIPANVKSVMDKTPASAVVAGLGVIAYGIYRKFFKKAPTA